MIVYKIRNKNTGIFLNRNGYSSARLGRVYSNIGHIKTSYGQGRFFQNKDDFEVVEFELTEKSTIPLNQVL